MPPFRKQHIPYSDEFLRPQNPHERPPCKTITITDYLNNLPPVLRRYGLCYPWNHGKHDQWPKFIFWQLLDGYCEIREFASWEHDAWGFTNGDQLKAHFGAANMRSKYHGETRSWVGPRRLPGTSYNMVVPLIRLGFLREGTKYRGQIRPGDDSTNPQAHMLIRELFEVNDFHVGRDWFHVVVLHNPKYLQPGEFIDMSYDVRQWRKEQAANDHPSV